MSKVVIIGNGHVGSHCAYTLAIQGVCSEIALIDIDKEKNHANVLDVSDAAQTFAAGIRIYAGDANDLSDAQVAVISIGCPRQLGQTRLDLLEASVRMLTPVTDMLRSSCFAGIVITITNPADVIAHLTHKALDFPRERVFGTGTGLDSARLRRTMGEFFGVLPSSISAFSIGEHGDSSTAAFSCASLGGRPFSQVIAENVPCYRARLNVLGFSADTEDADGVVRAAKSYFLSRTHAIGMEIIEGKGSTEFGIGAVLADTVRAVLYNEHKVLAASALLNGEYGICGIHAGVPCVIGACGIERVITLPLDEQEMMDFSHSCAVIEKYIQRAYALRTEG